MNLLEFRHGLHPLYYHHTPRSRVQRARTYVVMLRVYVRTCGRVRAYGRQHLHQRSNRQKNRTNDDDIKTKRHIYCNIGSNYHTNYHTGALNASPG